MNIIKTHKMKKAVLLFTMLAVGLTACEKDDFDDAAPVSLEIRMELEDDAADLGLSPEGAEVTLTNQGTGQTSSYEADAEGRVFLESLSPGTYDISATLLIPADVYNELTGTHVEQDIAFNVSLGSQSITESESTISLVLEAGRLGDWVIKQVYFAGSNVREGAVFRDQFIEIYNNSNQTLYADGLYFSQVIGNDAYLRNIDLTRPYFQANGQYDWTKSIGMSASDANENYLYIGSLFRVPGSGEEYPVLPGESIIIAQNAQNHKQPYTGYDGRGYSVDDPSLTVDLSGADFEVYMVDYLQNTPDSSNPLASDVDNPAVPNLEVLMSGSSSKRDFVMDNLGRDGFVIFKADEDPLSWDAYPTPDVTEITAGTTVHLQLPASLVIDAVQLQPTSSNNRIPSRFTSAIEAGFALVPGGSFSSESVIRKTSKTLEGRRILQDTNNSTEDFVYLEHPDVTRTVFK